MRKKMKSISLCLVFAFSLSSTASFAVQGGSIGQGDFSVLNGDKVVDTLKGQNPLDESSMLVCDGKCMVKSEGISLVAADQAKFAIKNDGDTFRLFLQAGSVDYVITEKARKIAFHTPEGVYSVAEVIFNAASDPVVRGTVKVTKDGKTEVSVKEGKLVFATADGMKTINANEKIILAQAITPPAAAPVVGGVGGGAASVATVASIAPWVAGAVVATAVAAGTVVVVSNNNEDDGDTDSSPSPTPSASPST